jgi:hypothetical protein
MTNQKSGHSSGHQEQPSTGKQTPQQNKQSMQQAGKSGQSGENKTQGYKDHGGHKR